MVIIVIKVVTQHVVILKAMCERLCWYRQWQPCVAVRDLLADAKAVHPCDRVHFRTVSVTALPKSPPMQPAHNCPSALQQPCS